MRSEVGLRMWWGFLAACCAVATVCGQIAAITVWIPHGSHGHAPGTLGYVCLYALWVLCSGVVWTLIVNVGLFALRGD